MRFLRRRRRAQTTTEYMMVISVICVAVYFTVTKALYPVVEDGSSRFRTNQAKDTRDGFVGTGHRGGEKR